MIRDCVFGIWYSVIAEFCSAGIWDSDIRDRDQDRDRDIGTAGYIRDRVFWIGMRVFDYLTLTI